LPYGATIRLNDSLQTSSVTANNFTDTLTYVIIAEDGVTEQAWNIIVTGNIEIVKSTVTDILSFNVTGQSGNTTINTI